MLYSVSHARHTLFVAEVSDIDVEGGAGLVCVGIMDQQCLELVLEADDAIMTIVQRRLLKTVRQDDDGGLAVRGQARRLRGRHWTERTAAKPRG